MNSTRSAFLSGIIPRRLFTTSSYLASTSTPSSAASPSNVKPPIFQLKNSNVFAFGTPSDDLSKALFRNISWTIANEDSWAIISSNSASPDTKRNLISTVLAQTRFSPSTSGSHPILATLPLRPRPAHQGSVDRLPTVDDLIQVVSFKTRLSGSNFEDYTARYYSIRDGDKLTVRQHLKDNMPYFKEEKEGEVESDIFEAAKALEMESFLELPLVTLSNGQTRRIRIVRALLARPELIILEEPFTGLDTASRVLLTNLLQKLQSTQSPRVLFSLRPQDPLPNFVSNIALVSSENAISFGTTEEILKTSSARELLDEGSREREKGEARRKDRLKKGIEAAKKANGTSSRNLVELKNVNVSYGPRNVLIDINWEIKGGERWVLSGHNGSGKSTLLSLILGDHPSSFTQDITLFGKPRAKHATFTLKENIGHISPEIFNAFPRKFGETGLTVEESIITGFNSIYSYRPVTPEQKQKLTLFLNEFNHPLYTPAYLNLTLASLPPGEQSLVLLLRALVKKPSLLVLDESFSFMNKEMVDFVKNYLDTKLSQEQAVIFISHFEEEIPNSMNRTLTLEHGKILEKN